MKTVEMESVRAPNADIISGNVAPEPAACKLTGPLTFLPATLNKPCADGTPTTSDAPLNILKPLENAPKGPSTAPIAPMIAPMSVQSKFTPINAKARKYKSSLFVSAVQSESEDHGATTATESEDVASDYAADHGNTTSEEVDTQRPVSAAVTPTVPLKGKKSRQTQPSKPIIKSLKRVRSRNDTTASRPSKRVRNTPLMRAAPRATPASTRVSKEFTNFTATIFMIKLGSGDDCPQFHVHETVLTKSPRFVYEINKAKSHKRATKHNVLILDGYDTIAFEQMIEYLYTKKFALKKDSHTAILRIQEVYQLFSLAGHFVLPELQKQAVKCFSVSRMLAKITPATFFDWAEDMYYEELDKECGSFIIYFRRVAPMLLQNCDQATVRDLCNVASIGGKYCGELFSACHTALEIKPKGSKTVIKKEEEMSTEQVRAQTHAVLHSGNHRVTH